MKKKKVGIIASSVAAIAVCSGMVVGSTFALFTSEDKVNIAVSSGKVEVVAKLGDKKELSSMGVQITEGNTWANGGTAMFTSESLLTVNNITPGDAVNFDINIVNNSTVIVKYRISYDITDVQGVNGKTGKLSDYLTVTAEDEAVDNWTEWVVPANESAKLKTVNVSVALPVNAGNEAQDSSAKISFKVEAVQGNAQTYTKETEAIINAINVGATTSNEALKEACGKDEQGNALVYFDDTLQLTDDGKAHEITLHVKSASGLTFDAVNPVLDLIGSAVWQNIANINSIGMLTHGDEINGWLTMDKSQITDLDQWNNETGPANARKYVLSALEGLVGISGFETVLAAGVDVKITDSKDTSHVYTMYFDITADNQ